MNQGVHQENHEWSEENLFVLHREYRQMLAKILVKVRSYKGTEQEYEEIMQSLINLEQWKIDNFGFENKDSLTDEEERRIVELFHPKHPDRTVNDLLGMLSNRFDKVLKENNEDEVFSKLDIVNVKLKGVLLPPDGLSKRHPAERLEEHEKRYEPRFADLVAFLNRHDVYTDDLIVCIGEILSAMQRRESYFLVEIPRLDREVLVSDEYGEATYAVEGILPRSELINLGKTDLMEKYGNKVTKIPHRSKTQWEQELYDVLFMTPVGPKINVRSAETVRQEFIKLYPTSLEWIQAIPTIRAGSFKLLGVGMQILSKKLGLSHRPNSTEEYYALGKKIYGEDPLLEYKNYTKEDVIAELKKLYPTVAALLKAGTKGLNSAKILNMGSQAFSQILGASGRPKTNKEFYEFGRLVFGDDPLLEKEKTREEIIVEIKKIYPTAKDWIKIKGRARQKLMIANIGVRSLAKFFDVEGNPQNNQKVFYELGRKIYGDDSAFEVKEYTKEELIIEIKRRYPTLDQWLEIEGHSHSDVKFFDLGITALSRYFGLEGNVRNSGDFYKLGQMIYSRDKVVDLKSSLDDSEEA